MRVLALLSILALSQVAASSGSYLDGDTLRVYNVTIVYLWADTNPSSRATKEGLGLRSVEDVADGWRKHPGIYPEPKLIWILYRYNIVTMYKED